MPKGCRGIFALRGRLYLIAPPGGPFVPVFSCAGGFLLYQRTTPTVPNASWPMLRLTVRSTGRCGPLWARPREQRLIVNCGKPRDAHGDKRFQECIPLLACFTAARPKATEITKRGFNGSTSFEIQGKVWCLLSRLTWRK